MGAGSGQVGARLVRVGARGGQVGAVRRFAWLRGNCPGGQGYYPLARTDVTVRLVKIKWRGSTA